MKTNTAEFGYFPIKKYIKSGQIVIETLPNLEVAKKDIEKYMCITNNWVYAPLRRVEILNKDGFRTCCDRHEFPPEQGPQKPGGNVRTLPYPQRVFSLPKTHRITHSDCDNEKHIMFHIWALSFFMGIRLTSAEAGFLDASSIKPGHLVDFRLKNGMDERAINVAEEFWRSNRENDKKANLVGSIIHTLFLAQSPLLLPFEQFTLLYTAIDSCVCLANLLKPSCFKNGVQANKIKCMCDIFKIEIDCKWIKGLVCRRNFAVHEALFMGEPLGLGVPRNEPHLHTQMIALICRLLFALLGCADYDYVRTPINSRQVELVSLK